MIFVTLGSQKFQFNRLLKEVDRLIEEGYIVEEIFAQIGYSDYKPKNYKYKDFLDRDEFTNTMSECDKVITHGGTGAIINAVKKGKKVIAVPRLKDFGEHIDNHQVEIVEMFKIKKFILSDKNIINLNKMIMDIEGLKLETYKSNTEKIVNSIDEFILNLD